MELDSLLHNNFDKIFLLTLSSRPDRLYHMKQMFNELHIDINKIDVHVTTPFPYNNIICKAFNLYQNKQSFTKSNEYDCARNHYAMVRQALDEGHKHILILEDDICFSKNVKLITDFINNIPYDYDILQFGGFTTNPKVESILNKYPDEFWVKHPEVCLWTTSMYALSKRGMIYYLTFLEKWFSVADNPLYFSPKNEKLVNSYAATVPIVIQADKEVLHSDIRSINNDNIDYKRMNVYESKIDKSTYFEVFKNNNLNK